MWPNLVPVTVYETTAASAQDAFRIAVPIDLTLIFTGFGPLPAVTGTREQTGAWDHVGASRRPVLSGGTTAFERVTDYDPPSYFAYEVSGFTNILGRLVHGARGGPPTGRPVVAEQEKPAPWALYPRLFGCAAAPANSRATAAAIGCPVWRSNQMKPGAVFTSKHHHRPSRPRRRSIPARARPSVSVTAWHRWAISAGSTAERITFRNSAQPQSCRLIDFEHADVRVVPDTESRYLLVVSGIKPCINMKDELKKFA